jgi:hypothetical protein
VGLGSAEELVEEIEGGCWCVERRVSIADMARKYR